MQIVIHIDEERYNQIKRCTDNLLAGELERAVKNGTPLPKGHDVARDCKKRTRDIDGNMQKQIRRVKNEIDRFRPN